MLGRLIDDLDDVDFLEKIKLQQKNWIGRSEGAEVKFKITGTDDFLTVFTTRPDTLFGATYMVIAPEHKLIEKYSNKITNMSEIEEYKTKASLKSDFERAEINKDKTGIEIKGITATNPLTGKEIPIWISDYVLSSYGTGAIMAVPAHDTRDYEFAVKFNLPIIQVLEEETGSPHENEFHKNSIVAVVYDEKEDKYLTINWHKNGGRLFIGGTIKENETALDCAIREIAEETGYTDLELAKLYSRIEPLGYHLEVRSDAKEYLSDKGYDRQYGARPLRRCIQTYLETPISEEIVEGRVSQGDTIVAYYDNEIKQLKLKTDH